MAERPAESLWGTLLKRRSLIGVSRRKPGGGHLSQNGTGGHSAERLQECFWFLEQPGRCSQGSFFFHPRSRSVDTGCLYGTCAFAALPPPLPHPLPACALSVFSPWSLGCCRLLLAAPGPSADTPGGHPAPDIQLRTRLAARSHIYHIERKGERERKSQTECE